MSKQIMVRDIEVNIYWYMENLDLILYEIIDSEMTRWMEDLYLYPDEEFWYSE